MELEKVEEIFEWNGAHTIYDKFKYQLNISCLFDHLEDPVVIEQFLHWYSFDETNCLYDDFVFHFNIFHNMYNKNIFLTDIFIC
jgi:hypothetical protein